MGAGYSGNPVFKSGSWSACTKNVCTCPNGVAAVDATCVTSGQHCMSCNGGYYLDAGAGMTNECRAFGGKCENGVIMEQSLRTQHNHCKDCNAGFYLNDAYKRCDAFEGYCLDGWLKEQSNRTAHNDCGSCKKGYHLDNSAPKRCIVWAGSCDNGILEQVAERTQDDHCGSCDPDFTLNRATHSCEFKGYSLPSEQRIQNAMSSNLQTEEQFFTDSNTITLITSVVIIAGIIVIIIMLAINAKKMKSGGAFGDADHDKLEQGKRAKGLKTNSTYSLEMTSLTPIDEKPINDENPTRISNPLAEASKVDA